MVQATLDLKKEFGLTEDAHEELVMECLNASRVLLRGVAVDLSSKEILHNHEEATQAVLKLIMKSHPAPIKEEPFAQPDRVLCPACEGLGRVFDYCKNINWQSDEEGCRALYQQDPCRESCGNPSYKNCGRCGGSRLVLLK